MVNIIVEALKEKLLPEQRKMKEEYERDTGHHINQQYLGYYFGNNQERAELGGMIYEFLVYKEFYPIKIYKKFICNAIIPTNKGTTEVDVIMITTKAIFVFECKHYSGNIYGDVKQRDWLYYIANQKHKFYNPIMQNKGHIKALMNLLELDSTYFSSIVLFSQQATVKIKNLEQERTTVTKAGYMSDTMKKSIHTLPDLFTNEQVDEIYNKLIGYCNNSEEVKQEHVESVIEKQNSCPRCGNKLVLRTSKTGDQFYGCTSFPKCRFTKKID